MVIYVRKSLAVRTRLFEKNDFYKRRFEIHLKNIKYLECKIIILIF